MAAQALDESFFITVTELNASNLDQCIYFTVKGIRCRWSLSSTHQERAKHIRTQVIGDPTKVVNLEILRNYARVNCCGRPGAEHRDRIEDKGLLGPLAIRWQNEIKERIANEAITPTLTPTSHEDEKSTSSSSTHVPMTCPRTDGKNPKSELQAEFTSSSSNTTSKSSSGSIEPAILTPTPESLAPRYDLRHRSAETSNSSVVAGLSKFRPRITEPTGDDTVSFKIRLQLERRDDETGALYIFKRDSSPGYVKIGWTAKSIQTRLDGWAQCGYTPRLIFKALDVPNAQRAETLTHYELMNEWRAERRCDSCGKTHREWFEISEERATQVVTSWTTFFKLTQPYDEGGSLKPEWQEIVEKMDKNGEMVTAKGLLGHYETTRLAEQTTVEDLLAQKASSTSQPPMLGNFRFGIYSTPATDLATRSSCSLAPEELTKKELLLKETSLIFAGSTVDKSINSSQIQQTGSTITRTPQSTTNPFGMKSVFAFQSPLHATSPQINAGLFTPSSDISLLSLSPRDTSSTNTALNGNISRKVIKLRSMRTPAKKPLPQMTPKPESPVPVVIPVRDKLPPELIQLPPSPPPSPI